MANDEDGLWIECRRHGRSRCAVVCTHHLEARTHAVGFVDISPAPDDLQAWCDACERLFVAEGEMTAAFLAFNHARVVCAQCFDLIRQRHSVASA